MLIVFNRFLAIPPFRAHFHQISCVEGRKAEKPCKRACSMGCFVMVRDGIFQASSFFVYCDVISKCNYFTFAA
ncbi:hypothetical protein GOP47_0025479 [Adiantum capillus-veneris]|uniref:Uncharacterized protein n=1 Tax=Adiantum capillus-veneris TaxID=13818 RepID=A0A9D4U1I1_ADICA|nr:hypothetical protein GOP47_0025479 [Adiantum capillus-veneris]